MAINAKQKKDNDFIEKVAKLYTDFCEKKKEYDQAIQQLACLEIKEEKFIPVKLLKPLCSYKKWKGDRAIPTKRDELVERYVLNIFCYNGSVAMVFSYRNYQE